jgi:hypothetical protein
VKGGGVRRWQVRGGGGSVMGAGPEGVSCGR